MINKENYLSRSKNSIIFITITAIVLFLLVNIFNLIGLKGNAYADSSISLTISNTDFVVNLASLSASGDFAESASSSINASTTSASGYSLMMSSSGNTNLTNTSDPTKSIVSLTSAISQNDFASSSNYNDKWGYKPSTLYDSSTDQTSSNTNFLPLPGTNGTILAKTNSANQSGTSDTYSLSFGARVNNQTAAGSYANDTFVIAVVANRSPVSCDNTKLCVEYDGNGLGFGNDPINYVNYNSSGGGGTTTKYSHTSNVNDAGVASTNYSNNMDVTNTVTIDGASSLNVTIYYDAESTSYDWVSVYQSPFTISKTNDATVSTTTGNLSGKLSGRKSGRTTSYTSWYTQSYTVSGDTVKFHFRSDTSQVYYGYYAIVTATNTRERSVDSGEYAIPTGTNATFYGWSSTQVTAGQGTISDVEYADESEVMANLPGDEGDTQTLYAVWQQSQSITFTFDGNVSSINVLDSHNTTVGTITSSGGSISLLQGETYTIKPIHASGYATDAIAKTSGAGTLNGKQFTVGSGIATLNVTSKVQPSMQSFDCSDLADVGDTAQVEDERDGETYLIGKLADNKCWMLDNLRLDLSNSTVLSNTMVSNTNVDETALNYFKNGGGSTSDQYSTDRINNAAWTSSSRNYYSIPMTNSTYKDTVSSVTHGEGSGIIGVYYNFCAASAGTFCWGNGTSSTGSPGGDPKLGSNYDIDGDICPKGWRLPTGSEYSSLRSAYSNDYTSFVTALSTPLSGYFYSGSASGQGSEGAFWSSTWSDSEKESYLMVASSYTTTMPRYRYYGNPVRCLAMDTNTYTLNFDKNTTDSVSNMPASQSYGPAHDDKGHYFTPPTDSSNIPTRSGWSFVGWSESSSDTVPTYRYSNGTFTPSRISVNAADSPKTLYAIWIKPQTITFTYDSNVTSIEVLDLNGNSMGNITTSGGTLTLNYPVTYTIKATHATGYTTNAVTKTSGAGTVSGKKLTVGEGSATINVTSKTMSPIQNFNCSTIAITGDTEVVYDKRDQKTYTISKLADGKCWMLDNLALDPTALTQSQLYGTGSDAGKLTNASNTTLGYLKNGGGSAPYATSAVTSNWINNDETMPLINADSINVVPAGATPGSEGSNKIGVYYTYCAASAGSYCSSSAYGNATEDLCPYGWRMPTGGRSGEYKALYEVYSSDPTTFKRALSLPLSGGFYNQTTTQQGKAWNQGTRSDFWTSSLNTGSLTFELRITGTYVGVTDSYYRGQGYSMRCIRSS